MNLKILDSPRDAEQHAAAAAAEVLRNALARSERARLVAATGRSQIGLLERLIVEPGIDWRRVELFHLDEYVGLGAEHPASFVRFLSDRLIAPTGIMTAHLLDGLGTPDEVIHSVSAALVSTKPDLLLAGLGENGHLAFNEPPADFNRRDAYFVVTLDEASRRQQVGEGWFESIEHVPRTAITMSIGQILLAQQIICVVLGARKAQAVEACFGGGVTPQAPASILQTHDHTTICLDREAAQRLKL